ISGDALYLVAAPIGPSGIAILGDLDHFVPMGKKRITGITDDGAVHVTVAFAPNESSRTITGYSAIPPAGRTADGAALPVVYHRDTHLFTLSVAPGPDRKTTVILQQSALSRPVKALPPATPVTPNPDYSRRQTLISRPSPRLRESIAQ